MKQLILHTIGALHWYAVRRISGSDEEWEIKIYTATDAQPIAHERFARQEELDAILIAYK